MMNYCLAHSPGLKTMIRFLPKIAFCVVLSGTLPAAELTLLKLPDDSGIWYHGFYHSTPLPPLVPGVITVKGEQYVVINNIVEVSEDRFHSVQTWANIKRPEASFIKAGNNKLYPLPLSATTDAPDIASIVKNDLNNTPNFVVQSVGTGTNMDGIQIQPAWNTTNYYASSFDLQNQTSHTYNLANSYYVFRAGSQHILINKPSPGSPYSRVGAVHSDSGHLNWFSGSWEQAGVKLWGVTPNYGNPAHFYLNVRNDYPNEVLSDQLIDTYDCSLDDYKCVPFSERADLWSCQDNGDDISLQIRKDGIEVRRNQKRSFHQAVVDSDNPLNQFVRPNDGKGFWLLGQQCLGASMMVGVPILLNIDFEKHTIKPVYGMLDGLAKEYNLDTADEYFVGGNFTIDGQFGLPYTMTYSTDKGPKFWLAVWQSTREELKERLDRYE